MKIFEENRLNSLDEKYFATTSPTPQSADSSWSSDCSCQIRSKISRNETNLKDLYLKITLELVDFKKKLEDIRNIVGNAGSPSSESPQAGATKSSPEGNLLLLCLIFYSPCFQQIRNRIGLSTSYNYQRNRGRSRFYFHYFLYI